MGLNGLEPSTSRLSGVRSNQLSYRPISILPMFQEKVNLSKLNKVFDKCTGSVIILRKEVIQPQVLLRLPCYDFTPIICPTLDGWLQKVTPPALGVTNSNGVTGGVYKARERIHRDMLIRDY